MYHSYWGLSESPFRGSLDARYFHQGISQEEALARLHFLVEQRRAVGMLLGVAGSGKSLLLEVFARQLPAFACQKARVNLAGLDAHDFLWALACQLSVNVHPSADKFSLTRAVLDHLAANRYQQISTVLLLDDGDEARVELIDEIVRLAQLDQAREPRLTVVLSAQPARIRRLGPRLMELAELRIDLEGWEADETAAYIKHALSLAGRSTSVFTPAALLRLHELADGVPRRVKQLADLALLAGAGQNLVQVEVDTVEAVFHELALATSAGNIATLTRG